MGSDDECFCPVSVELLGHIQWVISASAPRPPGQRACCQARQTLFSLSPVIPLLTGQGFLVGLACLCVPNDAISWFIPWHLFPSGDLLGFLPCLALVLLCNPKALLIPHTSTHTLSEPESTFSHISWHDSKIVMNDNMHEVQLACF